MGSIAVPLAVIFAGLLHATWNAIAKGGGDRYASVALIGLTQGLVCAPLFLVQDVPDPSSWPWLAGSLAVHVVYIVLLVKAYELGDFSQVYPLARGSAPLMVTLIAAVALGERLSPLQLAGVVAVCGGLTSLAFTPRPARPVKAELVTVGAPATQAPEPGPKSSSATTSTPSATTPTRGLGTGRVNGAVVAALATGVTIAAYTLLDGVGVRNAGSTASYSVWMFGLHGPLTALWALGMRGRGLAGPMRAQWATGAVGGLTAMAGYTIVLWAQTRGALASVAALRETGVIFGAIIGAVFFAERMGVLRVLAAAIVALGVVMITVH